MKDFIVGLITIVTFVFTFTFVIGLGVFAAAELLAIIFGMELPW